MKCCWSYELIVKESKILFSTLSLCTVPSKGSSHEARQWQMNISFIQKGQIAILYPSSWGNFSYLFWLKGSLTLEGRQLPKMQAPVVKSSSPFCPCTHCMHSCLWSGRQQMPSVNTPPLRLPKSHPFFKNHLPSFWKPPPWTPGSCEFLDLTSYHTR